MLRTLREDVVGELLLSFLSILGGSLFVVAVWMKYMDHPGIADICLLVGIIFFGILLMLQAETEDQELWRNNIDVDDIAIRGMVCILLRIITQFIIDAWVHPLVTEFAQMTGRTISQTDMDGIQFILPFGFLLRILLLFMLVIGNNVGRNWRERAILLYLIVRALLYSVFPHPIQLLTKKFNI